MRVYTIWFTGSKKNGRSNLKYFGYKNLIGRGGRMFNIIPVMVITLKPSKAVMAKWKYSFQEIAAVILNRLLLRKDKHDWVALIIKF
jgi:hypothetical protein